MVWSCFPANSWSEHNKKSDFNAGICAGKEKPDISFCNILINWIQLNPGEKGRQSTYVRTLFDAVWELFHSPSGRTTQTSFVCSHPVTFDSRLPATHSVSHSRTRMSAHWTPPVTGAWTRRLPSKGRSHYITQPLGVSPDSRSTTRAFPHLILRHDIERVPVQGEGHVPEDGAAVLHHDHRLVQHSSLQRTVHSDLQRQIKRGRSSEGLTTAYQLNGGGAFEEWHLSSFGNQLVSFVHLAASSLMPLKTLSLWENILHMPSMKNSMFSVCLPNYTFISVSLSVFGNKPCRTGCSTVGGLEQWPIFLVIFLVKAILSCSVLTQRHIW